MNLTINCGSIEYIRNYNSSLIINIEDIVLDEYTKEELIKNLKFKDFVNYYDGEIVPSTEEIIKNMNYNIMNISYSKLVDEIREYIINNTHMTRD